MKKIKNKLFYLYSLLIYLFLVVGILLLASNYLSSSVNSYLINNFDLDLHPNVIDRHFIEARLNCGQKCVISPNHCHYCYRIG